MHAWREGRREGGKAPGGGRGGGGETSHGAGHAQRGCPDGLVGVRVRAGGKQGSINRSIKSIHQRRDLARERQAGRGSEEEGEQARSQPRRCGRQQGREGKSPACRYWPDPGGVCCGAASPSSPPSIHQQAQRPDQAAQRARKTPCRAMSCYASQPALCREEKIRRADEAAAAARKRCRRRGWLQRGRGLSPPPRQSQAWPPAPLQPACQRACV